MRVIKRYYTALLLAVAVPVLAAVLFGLIAGVISVLSILAGAVIGAYYMATEVMDEMEKLVAEAQEQPFPFM